MKFLPVFEGFRLTPFSAPIFLTKDVLYLLSHNSMIDQTYEFFKNGKQLYYYIKKGKVLSSKSRSIYKFLG